MIILAAVAIACSLAAAIMSFVRGKHFEGVLFIVLMMFNLSILMRHL